MGVIYIRGLNTLKKLVLIMIIVIWQRVLVMLGVKVLVFNWGFSNKACLIN